MKNFVKTIIMLLMIVFLGCTSTPSSIGGDASSSETNPVEMMMGKNHFLNEMKKMKTPKGFLPLDWTSVNEVGIIKKDSTSYHEFFIYNDANNTVLILLSASAPYYFLKIESGEAWWHLDAEYQQIINPFNPRPNPEDKKANCTECFFEKGDYEVSIYFTPNEAYYGLVEGQTNVMTNLTQNHRNSKDKKPRIYELIKNSKNVAIFAPDFNEQRTADTFNENIKEGKIRKILYKNTTISTSFMEKISNTKINFPFIIGSAVDLSSLIDEDDLPITIDEKKILNRNYVVYFSLPLGNASNSSERYLSTRSGIVVLVRGNTTKAKEFFKKNGINTDIKLTPKLSFTDQYPNLLINWGILSNINIYISEDGINYNFLTKINNKNYTWSNPARGKKYWIKIVDADNNTEYDINTIVLGKNPSPGDLVTTEILWMGSSTDSSSYSTDEFIEIKNTSTDIIRLDDISIYVDGVKQIFEISFKELPEVDKNLNPGEYFVILNYKNYLFNEDGSGFNLTSNTVKHLVEKSISLGNSGTYNIAIKLNDSTNINNILVDCTKGSNGTRNEHSMVLDNNHNWKTSTHNIGVGTYDSHTFASPGFFATEDIGINAVDPEMGDLIITEILWMGSSTDSKSYSTDEFIEIKNISTKNVRLDNVSIYVDTTEQIEQTDFQSLLENERVLAPGEHFVILNYKNYLFKEDGSGFNLTNNTVKHLVNSSISLGNSGTYNITIKLNDSTNIDNVLVDCTKGTNGTRDEHSMVLDNSNNWITSMQDIGVGTYSPHTYATPGFSATGEK